MRTRFAHDPGGRSDACTVDQAKQSAPVQGSRHDGLGIGFLGDVAVYKGLPEFTCEGLPGLVLNIGQHHARTLCNQAAWGARPKARGPPGAEAGLVLNLTV